MARRRDALNCLICGRPGPFLEFDHIYPRSTHPHLVKGHPENIAPLCPYDHREKSEKRIKTWTSIVGPALFYHWQRIDLSAGIPGIPYAPDDVVHVAIDKKYKCLRPFEDVPVGDRAPVPAKGGSE